MHMEYDKIHVIKVNAHCTTARYLYWLPHNSKCITLSWSQMHICVPTLYQTHASVQCSMVPLFLLVAEGVTSSMDFHER